MESYSNKDLELDVFYSFYGQKIDSFFSIYLLSDWVALSDFDGEILAFGSNTEKPEEAMLKLWQEMRGDVVRVIERPVGLDELLFSNDASI